MSKHKMVCAECGTTLGEKEGEEDEKISRGICDNCFKNHFPHQYERIKAALEVDNVEVLYQERR